MSSIQNKFGFKTKSITGYRMDILLPSGDNSGEYLMIHGPLAPAVIFALGEYDLAWSKINEEFKELNEQCKAADDYREWNAATKSRRDDIDRNFASALIASWSMTDAFTPKNKKMLLEEYPALVVAILAKYREITEEFQAKK